MSLYQRLGQSQVITPVVCKFYQIMLQDKRVAHYFLNTDIDQQKARQVAFITLVTGGPNLYQGADMKTAHCKHSIGHFQFDATWENLQQALHFFNVRAQQVHELKEIFYSVQSQIFNKVQAPQTSQITPQTQTQVKGKCPFHQQTLAQQVPQKESPVDESPVNQSKEDESLYDRLGGHGAVYLVVNKFYDIMLEDPRVKAYFSNTDMERQKLSQIEFISMVTGGPNNYGGKDMKAAHCPYKIGHEQFDATWQNLEKAFGQFKVDPVLVSEVKEIFYSVEGEIVNSVGEQVVKKEQKSRVILQIGRQMAVDSIMNEQLITPVTQLSQSQECPYKQSTDKQWQYSQQNKCPQMSMKLKEIEVNCQKLSQCEKRKLRQEVIEKQQANKSVIKLCNNPYQRTYY